MKLTLVERAGRLGAPGQGEADQHQNHDTLRTRPDCRGGSSERRPSPEWRRRLSRAPGAPAAPALATTCTGWSRAVRSSSAAWRFPRRSARSAIPDARRRAATRPPMRFSAPARLGDIGRHFPDTDPRWKDASSLDLLTRAVALVAGQRVRGRQPRRRLWSSSGRRSAIHIDAMRAAVAAAIGVRRRAVSIKGKPIEGVDAIAPGVARHRRATPSR